MAIIFNGVLQKPYVNGEVHEVWCNDIKRWPSGNWVCDPSLASLAISHTVPDGGDNGQKIWIAVVDNGYGIVVSSPTTEVIDPVTKIEKHTWKREWVSEADEVSIAFVSGIQNVNETQKEYITESKPWVFWIKDQALYAQKLGTEDVIELTSENCDSVSAISGFHISGSSFFDYGLCVFFILSGHLYYRQLIGDVWYDASEVTMGPSGVTWIKVAAGRTWDYRLVIQLLGSDDNVYEIYTRHSGLGKLYTEYFKLSPDIVWNDNFRAIQYGEAKEPNEYFVLGEVNFSAMPGTLGPISLIRVMNIPDSENDYGKVLQLSFNKEVRVEQIRNQLRQFVLRDSGGHVFLPNGADYDNMNSFKVLLYFNNFNNAVDECNLTYTAGTVSSWNDAPLPTTTVYFTPTNLVPYEDQAPHLVSMHNE